MLATFGLLTLLAASEPSSQPTVSVMYFENASKDPELEYLKKGLADLMITDLAAWQGVRVVERTRLEEVIKEVEFQQTKYVDKKTASKLGQMLAADYLVFGGLTLAGNRLAMTARLVSSRDGETLLSAKEEDQRDAVFDMEQRLVNQLVAKVDAKLSADAQGRRKAKVPDAATVIAYGKALDLSDRGQIEEAQEAMRAVVSKAPTFLLGRERQQELLKAFEEYQKRKKDLITASVMELGTFADKVLADEARFDALTLEQKGRFLAWRELKGRFLARALKQHLTSRDAGTRLAKKGSEGQALLALRAWTENYRRGLSELQRARRQHANVVQGVSYPVSVDWNFPADEAALIQRAQLGDSRFRSFDVETLAEFVLLGRAYDGASFSVGPTLGAVDAKEKKAVEDEVDAEIQATLAAAASGNTYAANTASGLLEYKAQYRLRRADVDGAVSAYQQILDAFPTSGRASWVEGRIQQLLAGRSNDLDDVENWTEALKTCDDMAIRKSTSILHRRLFDSGLKAIDEVTGELLKACPVKRQNAGGIAMFLGSVAHTAATHDDCERYRVSYGKYLEAGGSVSEMLAWAKHYPWCPLGDLTKGVAYLHAKLDQNWEFEMREHLVSVLSYDGKVLTLMARTDGPRVVGGEEEQFDLRLEADPSGKFTCTGARWRRFHGKYLEGSCAVTLRKLADRDGTGWDEGTFEATFSLAAEGEPNRKTTLTKGEFKLKRN